MNGVNGNYFTDPRLLAGQMQPAAIGTGNSNINLPAGKNTITGGVGRVSTQTPEFLKLTSQKPVYGGRTEEFDSRTKKSLEKEYAATAAALGYNPNVSGTTEGLSQVQDPMHAQKLHILAA